MCLLNISQSSSSLLSNQNIHFYLCPILLNTLYTSVFPASYENCGKVGTHYSQLLSQQSGL